MRAIPLDFCNEEPPGAERVSRISGIPDIFAVNTIEPVALADIGRPDGAYMTESDSTMSTYNSFDVWRILAFRHGIEGWLFRAGVNVGRNGPDIDEDPPRLAGALKFTLVLVTVSTISTYLGNPTCWNNFPNAEETSTVSLRAFGSVLHIMPPSQTSARICAMVS